MSNKTIVDDLQAARAEAEALRVKLAEATATAASAKPIDRTAMSVRAHLGATGPAATAGTAPATPAATAKGKVSVKCALARARRDELNREHDAIEGTDPRNTAKLQAAFREKHALALGL